MKCWLFFIHTHWILLYTKYNHNIKKLNTSVNHFGTLDRWIIENNGLKVKKGHFRNFFDPWTIESHANHFYNCQLVNNSVVKPVKHGTSNMFNEMKRIRWFEMKAWKQAKAFKFRSGVSTQILTEILIYSKIHKFTILDANAIQKKTYYCCHNDPENHNDNNISFHGLLLLEYGKNSHF